MAKNEFLPFATEAGSLLQPLTGYANDDRRKHGNQPGIADPAFCNRTWRQSSLMAAALGELIAELGIDALDQNDVSKLKNAIKGAMTQLQQKGLSDSVTSDSSTTGASSKAVKTAFDAVSLAFTTSASTDDWNKATELGARYFIAGNLPNGPTPGAGRKDMFHTFVLQISSSNITQIAIPYNSAERFFTRSQYYDGAWGSWRGLSWVTDKATAAATADTAARLATARTIALSGDASGRATFDGSGNISIKTILSAVFNKTVEFTNNKLKLSNGFMAQWGMVVTDAVVFSEAFTAVAQAAAWYSSGQGSDGISVFQCGFTNSGIKLNGCIISPTGIQHRPPQNGHTASWAAWGRWK